MEPNRTHRVNIGHDSLSEQSQSGRYLQRSAEHLPRHLTFWVCRPCCLHRCRREHPDPLAALTILVHAMQHNIMMWTRKSRGACAPLAANLNADTPLGWEYKSADLAFLSFDVVSFFISLRFTAFQCSVMSAWSRMKLVKLGTFLSATWRGYRLHSGTQSCEGGMSLTQNYRVWGQ